MARLPDNYLGPKHRIEMLKKDFGHTAAILTEAKMLQVGEALCVMFVATIKINGEIIANGHAFTDSPEENKAVEKAETIAIGRALVNAGYPELDDGSWDDKEETKSAVNVTKPPKEKEVTKNVDVKPARSVSVVADVVDVPAAEPVLVAAPNTDGGRPAPARPSGLPKGLGARKTAAVEEKPATVPAEVATPVEETVDEASYGEPETPAVEAKPAAAVPEEQPKRLSAAELLAKYKK